MAALLGGNSFLRAEHIPPLKALRTAREIMWKKLSVPGREGTKPLLLELGLSSLTWKPQSPSGFGELKRCSHKAQLNEQHTVFRGWLGIGCCEMHNHALYLGLLMPNFLAEMLKNPSMSYEITSKLK